MSTIASTIDASIEEAFILSDDTYSDLKKNFDTIPVASADSNIELIRRVKAGDPEAYEQMIYQNRGLVLSIVQKNKRPRNSLEKEDLMQEGFIGLFKAIENYDESKGVAFSTFAIPCITRAINTAILKYDNLIKRPSPVAEALVQYASMVKDCHDKNVPLPPDEEIKRLLNLSDKMLRNVKDDYKFNAKSLSDNVSSDNDRKLQDILSCEETAYTSLEDDMNDDRLRAFLKTELSAVNYYIIYHLLLTDTHLLPEQVGKELGVSRQAIQQKEERILKSLRKYIEEGYFRKNLPKDVDNLLRHDLLRLKPISPRDITKFLFLRDFLTYAERELYREMIFGLTKYSSHLMAAKMSISVCDIREIETTLWQKEKTIFTIYKEQYDSFHAKIIAKYKSSLYSVSLDMDLSEFIDVYTSTYGAWKNSSYSDFESVLENYDIAIPDNMARKVREFFGIIPKVSIDERKLVAKINSILSLPFADDDDDIYYEPIDYKRNMDYTVYRKYLKEHDLEMDEKTKKIAELMLFGEKSLEETAEIVGIQPHEVSKSFIRTLNRIDYYRYGLMKDAAYSTEELLRCVNNMKCSSEIKIAMSCYIVDGDIDKALKTSGLPKNKFYNKVHLLYEMCDRLRLESVELSRDEIEREVNAHETANLLTVNERTVLSYLYGFKNEYNKEGIAVGQSEMPTYTSFNLNSIYKFKSRALTTLKAKKAGYLKAQFDLIDRDVLASTIDDKAIPLSNRERQLLKDVYGLGKQSTSIKDLSDIYGETTKALTDRLYGAVLTIKKYLNGEIPKVNLARLSSKLKYFSRRDRQVLIDIFKNGIDIDTISQKYSLALSQIQTILNSFYSLDEKTALDFDYFYSVVGLEDIPFDGDKNLALEIFDLYYEKSYSPLFIVKQYHRDLSVEAVKKMMTNLIAAVSEYRYSTKKTTHKTLADFDAASMEAFIRRYREDLSESEVYALEHIYSIHPRRLMKGSDQRQVLELLATVDRTPEKMHTLKISH